MGDVDELDSVKSSGDKVQSTSRMNISSPDNLTEPSWRIVAKKLQRAILFFVIIAIAIPLILASLSGIPVGKIMGFITSTFFLQAGAPVLGPAMGLSPFAVLVTMVCFGLGMVLAIFEICDSLSSVSPRVQTWVEKIKTAAEKYRLLYKYGVISCFFIAWIPPFGIYGAPVFAWIMKWKRSYAVLIIVTAFTVASILVLFSVSILALILSSYREATHLFSI